MGFSGFNFDDKTQQQADEFNAQKDKEFEEKVEAMREEMNDGTKRDNFKSERLNLADMPNVNSVLDALQDKKDILFYTVETTGMVGLKGNKVVKDSEKDVPTYFSAKVYSFDEESSKYKMSDKLQLKIDIDEEKVLQRALDNAKNYDVFATIGLDKNDYINHENVTDSSICADAIKDFFVNDHKDALSVSFAPEFMKNALLTINTFIRQGTNLCDAFNEQNINDKNNGEKFLDGRTNLNKVYDYLGGEPTELFLTDDKLKASCMIVDSFNSRYMEKTGVKGFEIDTTDMIRDSLKKEEKTVEAVAETKVETENIIDKTMDVEDLVKSGETVEDVKKEMETPNAENVEIPQKLSPEELQAFTEILEAKRKEALGSAYVPLAEMGNENEDNVSCDVNTSEDSNKDDVACETNVSEDSNQLDKPSEKVAIPTELEETTAEFVPQEEAEIVDLAEDTKEENDGKTVAEKMLEKAEKSNGWTINKVKEETKEIKETKEETVVEPKIEEVPIVETPTATENVFKMEDFFNNAKAEQTKEETKEEVSNDTVDMTVEKVQVPFSEMFTDVLKQMSNIKLREIELLAEQNKLLAEKNKLEAEKNENQRVFNSLVANMCSTYTFDQIMSLKVDKLDSIDIAKETNDKKAKAKNNQSIEK